MPTNEAPVESSGLLEKLPATTGQGASSVRKEPGKVAAAVKHSDNVNTAPVTAIEDEIIPYGKAP